MEFLFELILDIVLEGSIELSKSTKVPKYIRYLLIILLSLFFLSVFGLILFLGISIYPKNYIAGSLIIGVSLALIILACQKFHKVYILKTEEKEEEYEK